MRIVRIQFSKNGNDLSGEVLGKGHSWLQALGFALRHTFCHSSLAARLTETDEEEAREEDELAE